MKTIRIICLFIALLMVSRAYAKEQTIGLKDGTVYEGYISSQDYKNGLCEITYSRVTKTIPVKDIKERRSEKRDFSSLSKEWQEWAIANKKVEYEGKDKRFVSITTMTISGLGTQDYCILVSGAKSVTAFTITDGNDTCRTADIDFIRQAERDSTLLTDIDDIVQTDDATYTGVILEQIPGESFTVWNKYDNTVHYINYDEVRSIGKGRFNPDFSLWEQTPYLDVISLQDMTTSEGLIVENGFGDSVSSINVLFAFKRGDESDTRQYRISDIVSIQRHRNPDYKPLYDIVLEEGESRINRDSVLVFANIQSLTKRDSTKMFYLNPDKTDEIAIVNTSEVTVETNTPGIAEIFIAEAMNISVPQPLLNPENPDNKSKSLWSKKDIQRTELLAYTYSSLFLSEIDSEVSTSMNHTTKIVFSLPNPGTYFVYLRRLNKCWVIQYQP